ncbi:uncharacterized protein METZ01_LOCUS461592 [marine metagenome]|uniref:Uncharacterized protein n=1 Tax=marine metagenome TaxID=408172 RepID=A0A383ANP3_9ZZZZ
MFRIVNKHQIFVIVNLISFLPLMWLTATFSFLPIWIIFCAFGLIYAIATRDKSIDFNLMVASGGSEEGQRMLERYYVWLAVFINLIMTPIVLMLLKNK